MHPHDYGRFKELGVLPNMQTQWAERDSYTIDAVRPYIGRRRWRRLYPAGSLHRSGARVCGGSDWPVDPLLPCRRIAPPAGNLPVFERTCRFAAPLRRNLVRRGQLAASLGPGDHFVG